MKKFFVEFAIDTVIRLVLSIYKKKGKDALKKFFKEVAYKTDILLDKSVRNENSTEVRMCVSDTLYDLANEIRSPILRRDNSEK